MSFINTDIFDFSINTVYSIYVLGVNYCIAGNFGGL